jgi:predicted hotdog family 3-hydroxylacyl-ACP dehydratase
MSFFPPVSDLLPHTGRMVLVDEVVFSEPDRVRCRLTIRPDSLFVNDGRVRAAVAVEYMAQAIGVYAGLRAHAAGRPIEVGYLIGTRQLTLDRDHFEVGDELMVDAEHLWGEEHLGSFRCVVRRGADIVAEAVLNVYRGPLEGTRPT